jgi:ribose-phosphate pyrophosphokinase
MIILKLLGVTETSQYKAWKFPGGEIHVKLEESAYSRVKHPQGGWIDDKSSHVFITSYFTDNDDLILLALVVNALRKQGVKVVSVYIPYLPYQQADRYFSDGEPLGIKIATDILNNLPVDNWITYDVHSDVGSSLLNKSNCQVISNDKFAKWVIEIISNGDDKSLILLSPDAGAYKKIFKLASNIGFSGRIECCNKYRDSDGNVTLDVPQSTFMDKNILIIDDICVGGATFIAIANQLKNRPRTYKGLYLAVSHGIFSNGMDKLKENFNGIFTTNSRLESRKSENVYDGRTEALNYLHERGFN